MVAKDGLRFSLSKRGILLSSFSFNYIQDLLLAALLSLRVVDIRDLLVLWLLMTNK